MITEELNYLIDVIEDHFGLAMVTKHSHLVSKFLLHLNS